MFHCSAGVVGYAKSKNLSVPVLAGDGSKLFMQPVLIDGSSTDPA